MDIKKTDSWGEFINNCSQYVNQTSVEDFNYAVNISLKNKYVFIETAKVACSTIKLTLQGLEVEEANLVRSSFEVVHNRAYSPLLSLQQIPHFKKILESDEYFKFCFVRNPYTRLLSAYIDKIHGNSLREKTNILLQMGHDISKIEAHISFEQFVSSIEEQSPKIMNNHWRHQYYSTYQDNINYSFIGKLEQFDEDFSYVMHKLDALPYYRRESPHATHSLSRIHEYYTEDMKERVYKLFQIDFEAFDYKKDLPEK